MNKIKIFESEQFGTIRAVVRDSEPWFVAPDVCKAMGYANTTMALHRIKPEDKVKLNLGLRGGDVNVVSKKGLFDLACTSPKREAREFICWVAGDVIPAINDEMQAASSPEKAMTELHAAMSAMRDMLDDMEKRFPFKQSEPAPEEPKKEEPKFSLRADELVCSQEQLERVLKRMLRILLCGDMEEFVGLFI